MSDANAVAVLAALTSWYPLRSNLNDSHGSNDLVTGVSASYEAGGKVAGNRLAAGSRGACTLASSIPISSTTGKMFVGGWIYYTGAMANQAEFGLSLDYNGQNEQLTISSGGLTGSGAHTFKVFGWNAVGGNYLASDPNTAGVPYDFTVRVEDSLGAVATSAQSIIIRDPGDEIPDGWYFVVGQWDEGNLSLHVHGRPVATSTAPSVSGSPVTKFQIGNQFGPANTAGALSEIFFGDGAILTDAQIAYLYNLGAGKSYTDIVADAA